MFITSIKFVQTIRAQVINLRRTNEKYQYQTVLSNAYQKKKTERKLDKQERNYDVQILKLYQIRPIFNNFEYNAKQQMILFY